MAAWKLFAFCVTLITCITTCTGAVSQFNYGMKQYTLVLDQKLSQSAASNLCEIDHSSILVDVLDTALLVKLNEWLFLSQNIDSKIHELWIGGKSDGPNNQYFDLQNYQPHETGARCLVLSNITNPSHVGYNLVSKDCSGSLNFICEKTEMVSSSATFGLYLLWAYYPNAKRFDDHDHSSMLSKVTVYEYKTSDIKFISGIDFTYGNGKVISRGRPTHWPNENKYVLELLPGEFITEVSGQLDNNLVEIKFTTNWKRTIGSHLNKPEDRDHFTVSNNGAPLIYVSGTSDEYILQLKFHFFSLKVDNLKDFTDLVAQEVYDTTKNRQLEKLVDINIKYQYMVPDVASKGCSIFTYRNDSNYVNFEAGCLLKILLEQLNIYTTSTNALKKHLPRNLMEIANYNSQVLLKVEKDSNDFHTVITQLTFTITQVGQAIQGTIVSVNQNMADNLNKYLSSVADYDRGIAVADKDFITGKLTTLKTESDNLMTELKTRITVMLAMAVTMTGADALESSIKLAATIAKNFNPLGWLFGANDPSDIADRVSELTRDLSQFTKAIKLISTLHIYSQYLQELAGKFAKNEKQLNVMRVIIDKFTTATSESELKTLATEFIASYNDYTPAVSAYDVEYAAELLSAVVGEGCDLIAGTTGTIANILTGVKEVIEIPVILGRQEPSTVCTELQPLLAKLKTMYESVFNFQFELTEKFAGIARTNIAKTMAGQISDLKTLKKISIVTAAAGTLMVEIRTQAVAQARCREIEYQNGGKRPQICRHIHFTDNTLTQIIAYTGNIQPSDSAKYAYIPMAAEITNGSANVKVPYFDAATLVANKVVYFQLPIKDKNWMVTSNWLPSTFFDPSNVKETAYFIKKIEMFIPGLKCRGLSDYDITLDITSESNVKLYSEESPATYVIPEVMYRFKYKKTAHCPSETIKDFPVYEDGSPRVLKNTESVCVLSEGSTVAALQPSLYSTWRIRLLTPQNCDPYIEKSAGYSPLITFNLLQTEVRAAGIEDCWPEGSRCDPGKRCVDGVLSYTCQSNP